MGKIVYLDSDAFLAWLKEEKNDIEFLELLSDVFGTENYTRMVSTLVYAEVFTENKEYDADFKKLMDKIEIFPMTADIAILAGKLRRIFPNKGKPREEQIYAPDMIHLATALLRGADYFCTKDKRLINLDGNKISEISEGKKITITKSPINPNRKLKF